MTSRTAERFDPARILLDRVLESYADWKTSAVIVRRGRSDQVEVDAYGYQETDVVRVTQPPPDMSSIVFQGLAAYTYRDLLEFDLWLHAMSDDPSFEGRGRLTYYLRAIGHPPTSYMNWGAKFRVTNVLAYALHYGLVR